MKKNYLNAGLFSIAINIALGFSHLSFSQHKTNAIDLANVDSTVSPCTDFFQFANGGWLKKNPIPASESKWGSFNELDNKNNIILKEILEGAATNKKATKGSIKQKVGDFYYSGMDSLGIEKAGIAPLQPYLTEIENAKDKKSLLEINTKNQLRGIGSLYGYYVDQDEKKSSDYAIYFLQGGIGLPDRDYYLKTDQHSKKIREEYVKHIQKMLELSGVDGKKAKDQAEKILALETELAKFSMTKVQMRDPYATYNKMSISQVDQIAPQVNFNKRLAQMGVKGVDSVIVGQPAFYTKVSKMVDSVSLNDWKTYFRWHLVRQAAPSLSNKFVKENFNFYGKTLTGTTEMQPRWKRISKSTSIAMGEALGQLYVEKAFSPKAKERANEMVNNLQWAFKQHLDKVDWMSKETKAQALKKLESFSVKIGYPDKWRDYSALEIARCPYVENVLAANEFKSYYHLNKLGKPINRSEWHMPPQTVNAYYSPTMNEIVFPAGILQPPFFDPLADNAVNYGGIGAVIGHEITHGFDDQGRQYDEIGNLREWWNKEDAANFTKRATAVETQFDNYEVLDSLRINGKLTLGENIADLGGLSIAYTALQKALKESNPGKIEGLTPEQRFFLSWAQIWRMNIREEALRQQILTDPHSPARYRVNGPLSNLPEFHKAFNCKPSDKMVANDEKKATIW